ncbi:MAG: tRNA preQ1(34) S-adenosylmethionine ribosyltransferase-isomerase QueA [Pseudomonadota bacterium]|jgi:S-adenosylmethionine:tRNA ribosyltransferase-isomerase
MKVDAFDFHLPEQLIAMRPASPRDSARMLVVRPDGFEHRLVSDLPSFLSAGDALVTNDTRVIAARLHGVRLRETGPAKIEILLHRRLSPTRYSALARPARKLAVGDALEFGSLKASVVGRGEAGEAEIAFALSGAALDQAIAAQGEIPLPPYIAGKRAVDEHDSQDYQTVFARECGSVAAPTAGLHFTPELLARLAEKGISREAVTLHVGLGTFLPVTAEETGAHRMHAERAILTHSAAARLNDVHAAGGRIVAAGTTSLRSLESAADADGRLAGYDGDTDIFITPGYRFRAVDVLLTNFHLPRSTLFMLVSAFMGLEVMKAAYAEAMRENYRFYSYGDACLLIRPS